MIIISKDCVDIISTSADPTRNFFRVRFRNPKLFVGGKYSTPQWGQKAAMTIGTKYYGVKGCKITMAQPVGGRWMIQNVLIPKNGGVEMTEELALQIANHIQDRIEREGQWTAVMCRDNETKRYISKINGRHIERDERGRFAPHAAEEFDAEEFGAENWRFYQEYGNYKTQMNARTGTGFYGDVMVSAYGYNEEEGREIEKEVVALSLFLNEKIKEWFEDRSNRASNFTWNGRKGNRTISKISQGAEEFGADEDDEAYIRDRYGEPLEKMSISRKLESVALSLKDLTSEDMLFTVINNLSTKQANQLINRLYAGIREGSIRRKPFRHNMRMEAEEFGAWDANCSVCNGTGWMPKKGDPKKDTKIAKLFGLSIDELTLTPCNAGGKSMGCWSSKNRNRLRRLQRAEEFEAEYMRKGWKIERPFEDYIQATKENPYRFISIIYNEGDYEPYLIYRTTGSGEYYFKTLDEALDWLNGDNEIYEGGKDFRNAEEFGVEEENCPKCSSDNIGKEEMPYCYTCGRDIRNPHDECYQCGSDNMGEEEMDYCYNCGEQGFWFDFGAEEFGAEQTQYDVKKGKNGIDYESANYISLHDTFAEAEAVAKRERKNLNDDEVIFIVEESFDDETFALDTNLLLSMGKSQTEETSSDSSFDAEEFEAQQFYNSCSTNQFEIFGRNLFYKCSNLGSVRSQKLTSFTDGGLGAYRGGDYALRLSGGLSEYPIMRTLSDVSHDMQPSSMEDWKEVVSATNQIISATKAQRRMKS